MALYWRAPYEQVKPRWLDGCADLQQSGIYWWVGDPIAKPNFERLKWTPTANGWAVAQDHRPLDPSEYLRPRRWAMSIIVEDARGVDWMVPAILAPDGVPAVAQVRRRVNGEWQREYVSDAQEAAVDAALAVRSGVAMTLEEQSDAVAAIMEVAYFLDAETIGALGLMDDVLAVHALKMAAGMVDHAED